jgi:SAM-dependent methyltransferase
VTLPAAPDGRALEARAFAVLAFAAELVRRPVLLATFAAHFGANDDATLVVVTSAEETGSVADGLQRALHAAGIADEHEPDLLLLPLPAGEVGALVTAEVDVVLTDEPLPDELAGLPRVGVADGPRLRELARRQEAKRALRARLPERFALPEGYASRVPPDYFHDAQRPDAHIVYQPHVYALAARLAERMDCTHIVDLGCGAAEKLVELAPRFHLIGVDFGPNLAHCRARHPEHTWLEWDAERAPAPPLPPSLLTRSVIVCADVIEHLMDPTGLLMALAGYIEHAPVALVSTPDRVLLVGPEDAGPPRNPSHVREWSLAELVELASAAGLPPTFAGLTVNNDHAHEKSTVLLVVERAALRRDHPAPDTASDYAWELELGPDEVLMPPWRGVPLRDALHHVARQGYGAVECVEATLGPGGVELRVPSRDAAVAARRSGADASRAFPYRFVKTRDAPAQVEQELETRYLVERLSGIGVNNG